MDPKSSRKCKVVWSKRFECDHAGAYHDTRKPELSPSKQCNRGESIRCGCKASIYASQPVGKETVTVRFNWEHNRHDPASLDDLQTSRNPEEVCAWLDTCVNQGFNQKAIKALLRMTPKQLSQITLDAEHLPFSIKISPMDIYNTIHRKVDADTRLAPGLAESIDEWVKRLQDTEALTIRNAFPELVVHILYCYWHLWQAWDKHLKEKLQFKHIRHKENRAESVKDVCDALVALLQSKTPEDFDRQWIGMQKEWADQPKWLKYMTEGWILKKERWARAWRKHAHYGIDTNNFIESWHSNLKKNYIGRGQLEPDYFSAHVRSGLGFKGRNLCKAEVEAKKRAHALSFREASSCMVLEDSLLYIESFTQDNKYYEITLEDSKIMSCNCPSHVQSHLTCKHMFLAIRVTNYAIHLPHAIIPAHRLLETDEGESLVNKRTRKRRLVVKAHEILSALDSADYWVWADNDDLLDGILEESLAKLVSAVDGLRHIARDTMLVRPDNAKQW
ncbi:hypothetical protein M422DRAFT_267434 [Sphaerobolus stellatus SS14]|uniref:SWIM-type domain-containing protein n=1 Tax=Sphaerobolus stellatus (strain SS14) TaxID=990650 RepID=A0A0C9UPT8_SPHS4|nr:hypothetical protein M422DRAFT_267434 [Sphaerobolus stellatus SS14]